MMEETPQTTDQIKYLSYEELQNPNPDALSAQAIEDGLSSKDWRLNFDALTNLRSANKFYASVFAQELLPKNHKGIVQQIQNLRSNNSKEALTLASEILEHQKLENLTPEVLEPIVEAIFSKTVSEKGFLKKEALSGVTSLAKKYNPCLAGQLSALTQSLNGSISELAIKILAEYIQYNKITQLDGRFYSLLASNIEGKRAILQRKGKEILQTLVSNRGEDSLCNYIETLCKESQLPEEQSSLLIREIKRKNSASSKSQPAFKDFKDFLKCKKKEDSV